MGRRFNPHPTIKRTIQINDIDWIKLQNHKQPGESIYETFARLMIYFEQDKGEIVEQYEQAKRTIAKLYEMKKLNELPL